MHKINWNCWLWLPLASFIVCLSLFALFNLDHGLQDWLYQSATGFPFQNNELYERWLHNRIKIASNSLLFIVLIVALWPKHQLSWSNFRVPLLVAILAMIASVSAMQSLKKVTGIYCPVQLLQYGGSVELNPKIMVGHLLLVNNGEGRCWPAGHATAGFAWLALFFAFSYMGKKSAAIATLVAALIYGHFLGLTQVIRGQHFLSHQFYTMAICWLISLLFFVILYNCQHGNKKPVDSSA